MQHLCNVGPEKKAPRLIGRDAAKGGQQGCSVSAVQVQRFDRDGGQQTMSCNGAAGYQPDAELCRGYCVSDGKILVQKVLQRRGKAMAYGRVCQQDQCTLTQRLLYRKAGVVKSTYRDLFPVSKLQYGISAGNRSPAEAVKQEPQPQINRTAAEQQPPGAEGEIDTAVVKLHTGQKNCTAQQKIEQEIPGT